MAGTCQAAMLDKNDRLEQLIISEVPDGGHASIEFIKARPEVRLKKWNGEVNLGVRYDGVSAVGARFLSTDLMAWKGIRQEIFAYPLAPSVDVGEDGGLEIELVLREKPATNAFPFQIDGAESLDFFYQPPLDETTPMEGWVSCAPTQCLDAQGRVVVSRPENVVGSYAVYHKTAKDHQVGAVNYATGKAFHIYRPKVIDALNGGQWAELSYASGVLTVTVPQAFLDAATYPVMVDPTFGITDIAATSANTTGSSREGLGLFSPASTGTLDSVSFYCVKVDPTGKVTGGVYNNSSNYPGSLVEDTAEGTVPASAAWVTMNANTAANVTGGTNYFVAYQGFDAISRKYDSTGASGLFWKYKFELVDYVTGVMPDPFPASYNSFDNNRFSIYATYTATARRVGLVTGD